MKQTTYIDVMLDIETLGVADDAQVIQISAGAFDLETIVTELSDMKTFDCVLDLSTLGDTLTVEQGTLKFWTSDTSNATVLHRMLTNDNGVTEKIMVEKLHKWLLDLIANHESCKLTLAEIRLWGNGIIFDNVKIENLFKKYGLQSPVKFYNHRDVRTIVELVANKKNTTVAEYRDQFSEGIEKHNAIHDVLYQARYVTHAYKDLMFDASKKYYWTKTGTFGGKLYLGTTPSNMPVTTSIKGNSMLDRTTFTEGEVKELMGNRYKLYTREEINK